jgi:hypothetical protein
LDDAARHFPRLIRRYYITPSGTAEFALINFNPNQRLFGDREENVFV